MRTQVLSLLAVLALVPALLPAGAFGSPIAITALDPERPPDGEAIRAKFEYRLTEFVTCLRENHQAGQGEQSVLVLLFRVGENRRVGTLEITTEKLAPRAAPCARRVLKSMRFEKDRPFQGEFELRYATAPPHPAGYSVVPTTGSMITGS